MIELREEQLHFQFPGVHANASCNLEFVRTLRIPDDNREYDLPPGLGQFPLDHVDDFAERVPESWVRHGGVFLPMYQAEALWLSFGGRYPMAVKIAAGKINALTGEPWRNALSARPQQDYLVLPDQPWLDGFYAGKGLIRQFVAMELGDGYTAEEQITGEAEHGGLQIVAYPMKASVYEKLHRAGPYVESAMAPHCVASSTPTEMGLAPGGLMRQEIYEDEHGIEAWDQTAGSRCFIHILNSVQYYSVTGRKPPTEPPTARAYSEAGLPWFEYYDRDRTALNQFSKLQGLDSVSALKRKKGEGPLAGNDPVQPAVIKKLSVGDSVVREWD